MAMSAATQYSLVKGWFNDTLPNAKVGPIALLRMDADWYDSTKQILDSFAHRLVSGGLIIVDDYYLIQGCTRAVNECAAARSWMIRQYRFWWRMLHRRLMPPHRNRPSRTEIVCYGLLSC